MNSTQTTFLSGAIFGAALGLVCGHFTIWQYSNVKESTTKTHTELPAGYVFDGPYFPAEADFDLGERSASLPPEFFLFNDSEETADEETESPVFENAIAFETEEAVEEAKPQQVAELDPAVKSIPLDAHGGEEPQPLSIPEAQSLQEHTAKSEEEIRALIDRELPDAPASQKEVWFDSLKDLGSDDVTGVLKMWKMFGGPTASIDSFDHFHAPDDPHSPSKIQSDKRELIEQAIEWHQHNLLMASTPGYLRIVPTFIETKTDDRTVITKLEKRRSFERGEKVVTNHPFDLSMKVAGFFEVKSDDGEVLYTKRGDFCLNKNQKLSLVVDGTEYIAQPEQTVPCPEEERDEAEEPYHFLYRSFAVSVINHSDLIDAGNGLFKVREGGVVLEAFNTAEQGMLEASNVDPDEELEAIVRLQKMLE